MKNKTCSFVALRRVAVKRTRNYYWLVYCLSFMLGLVSQFIHEVTTATMEEGLSSREKSQLYESVLMFTSGSLSTLN